VKPRRAARGAGIEPATEAGAASAPERALRVLALVARSGKPLSLAELCAELSMAKPTLHRLCGQLLAQGLLSHDVGSRNFTPGPALRQLALDTLHNAHQSGRRHQVLKQLVAQVGETCNFTTLDGAQVRYVDRIEAQWPLRLTLEVGTHVPLHCTASGKLFLAHLPAAERQATLASLAFEAMTPHTHRKAATLARECEQILRDGHACDRQEFILGLIAVAVPVRDAAGQVRAAVAMHAPIARMNIDQALARLPDLQHAAQRLGALL
jgi:DNA-binding IclR family transcriptional regulator